MFVFVLEGKNTGRSCHRSALSCVAWPVVCISIDFKVLILVFLPFYNGCNTNAFLKLFCSDMPVAPTACHEEASSHSIRTLTYKQDDQEM